MCSCHPRTRGACVQQVCEGDARHRGCAPTLRASMQGDDGGSWVLGRQGVAILFYPEKWNMWWGLVYCDDIVLAGVVGRLAEIAEFMAEKFKLKGSHGRTRATRTAEGPKSEHPVDARWNRVESDDRHTHRLVEELQRHVHRGMIQRVWSTKRTRGTALPAPAWPTRARMEIGFGNAA